MPLFGTNAVVSGSRKSLPDMRCGRNSVDRVTRSEAEDDALGGKHDVGLMMD